METYYKGRLMRSKLEARWAAFFDHVGWEYDYEPALDLNGWIPDFILYAGEYTDNFGIEKQHKILVEIKPYSIRSAFNEVQDKIERAVKDTEWQNCEVLLLGSSVFKSKDFVTEDGPAYGLLGWFYQCSINRVAINKRKEFVPSKYISEAYPVVLSEDNYIGYDLTDGYMFSRFNGYWDHFYGSSQSHDWASQMLYDELKMIWDCAGNAVQWRKPYKLFTNSF